MLEMYFSAAKMLGHLRSGPSGPYLDGFAAALEEQGYGPETAVRYLRAAAHIGHVMAEQGVGLTDVDLAAFGEHLRTCRCPRAKGGRRNHHTIYGARLFRRHLVELGVCRSAAVGAASAEPQLVADFKTWLRKHRGASDPTVRLYARDAAGLMMELRSDPAGWRPNDVRSYFLERASNSGSGTIEKMATSLRAFLRYLAVAGRCQAGLDGAVPAYAHWQLADMPRYLSTEQVDRLIAACDGDAGARRRDRAIVLLWCASACGLVTWRNCVSPISSGKQDRCGSAASRATRSGCRYRKTSGMPSPPTSNTGRLLVAAISCSCARSRRAGHSDEATASHRW
jgi:hypothetical protein